MTLSLEPEGCKGSCAVATMQNLIRLGVLCGVITVTGLTACGSDDDKVALRGDGGAAGEGDAGSSPAGQGGDGLSVGSPLGGEPNGGVKGTPSAGAGASGGEGGGGGLEPRVPGRGAVQIAVGASAICVLLDSGAVRCWGVSSVGQLGHADHEQIGDDETPFNAADVDVGGKVTQVVAGQAHVCALLETGAVRCWGAAPYLGYGNSDDIGDDEAPAIAGDVDVGGKVIQLAASERHTCALLLGGTVRCWGWGGWGELGYGDTKNIGDDETPASVGDVDVGGTVTQIAAGSEMTCALLSTGAVRCWGVGGSGGLGYGNQFDIGDDETPASAGDVSVGGKVTQIAAGSSHACALLSTGNVRCWGEANDGRLGYGNTFRIGDDETPASAGDLDIGGKVSAVAVGGSHNCALLVGGNVRCWGAWNYGSLGYGNTDNIGDDETPASAGDVDVGGTVMQLAASADRTCALLTNGAVRCWGDGVLSILGYANGKSIGDDETPASAGDVLY
jgi:alpha-tubulin suppressor-like RCC1 family protein